VIPVPDERTKTKSKSTSTSKSYWRQIALAVIAFLAIFVAASGGVTNPSWAELLRGVAVSVLAAIISVLVLARDQGDHLQIEEIAEFLAVKRSPHILWANRNLDVSEEEWLDLIAELDNTVEPVWFLGEQLSWWTKAESYREPLRRKFLGRARNVLANNRNGGEDYSTNILLGDSGVVSVWETLIASVIEEAVAPWNEVRRPALRKLCREKFLIALLPPESVKYSAVLCGSRLSVTNYISHGNTPDCPTLSIRRSSPIWILYANDLKLLSRDYGMRKHLNADPGPGSHRR
jgi:hypothetical protein